MKIIKMGDIEVTTGQDAADYLGVHPNTVRRWADEGYLPVIALPSGVRRFPLTGLMEMAHQRGIPRTFDINNPSHVSAWRDLLVQTITIEEAGSMFKREENILYVTLDTDTFDIFSNKKAA